MQTTVGIYRFLSALKEPRGRGLMRLQASDRISEEETRRCILSANSHHAADGVWLGSVDGGGNYPDLRDAFARLALKELLRRFCDVENEEQAISRGLELIPVAHIREHVERLYRVLQDLTRDLKGCISTGQKPELWEDFARVLLMTSAYQETNLEEAFTSLPPPPAPLFTEKEKKTKAKKSVKEEKKTVPDEEHMTPEQVLEETLRSLEN